MMSTEEIVRYYGSLLILQYVGKEKARATIEVTGTPIIMPQFLSVQFLSYSDSPASGSYTLIYDDEETVSIAYNANASAIETALQALTGLSNVSVSGSAAEGFYIDFDDVTSPAKLLEVGSSTLDVEIEIEELTPSLPLAVQNGFTLGDPQTEFYNIALGVQLDTVGKYAGVTRYGYDLSGAPVQLSDADFTSLIRMAIVRNNSGSSLETIQNLLNQFFEGLIFVTDYANMRLSYLISGTVGTSDLIQMFITKGLLPKPMGVGISVAVVPDIEILFAFRTYDTTIPNGKPFNRYPPNFNTDWRWLSYADIL